MSKRTWGLWAFAPLTAAMGIALGGTGCVTPQNDFNDYISRAADAQGPPLANPIVDAGVDAALLHAPDAAFTDNKYGMACYAIGLAADVSQAFLFQATISYTPTAGGGGTLSFEGQPLVAKATNVNSPIGNKITPPTATVKPDGTATLIFAQGSQTVTLPGPSDLVANGQDVVLDNLNFNVQVEADKVVCGALEGDITKPTPAHLSAASNPCIILPVDKNGNLPSYTAADFHCP